MTNPPRNLCILRLSAIGDICHTLPVVRTLQDHLPDTNITWVVGKLEHSLLEGLDGIRLLPYDKRGGLAALRELHREFSGEHFDALLHMQVALRASAVSLAIPAVRRIGFDRARARDWQWLFTNERISPGGQEHVLDGLMGFARALGITPSALRWDIPVRDEDREFAENIIPEHGRTLIISPCSSQRARNFRNWPIERYAEVATHAVRRHGMQVIISGGPSSLERQYAAALRESVPGCIDLVGKTSLKQLLALLERACTLISPDSGPVHMATAAGTPVIGLYATSNPERTGPYLHRKWTVNRYPQAVRRFLGKSVDDVRWGQRVRHADAMLLVETDAVIAKLDELVAQSPS